MSSVRARARMAGVLYLLLGITAPIHLLYIPRTFYVTGDAAATAANILAGELIYRLGIFVGLVSNIVFLFLVVALYDLLKEADRRQARLMVMLVGAGVAVGVVNLLNEIAPLILLSGAELLAVFSRPQLDALALGFLRLSSSGNFVGMAFWGLWLLPFGVLVFKSRLFPKVLGVLLILGCPAYLAVSFTALVFPAHRQAVDQVALPFYAVGEVAMFVYLLVKGARVEEGGVGG